MNLVFGAGFQQGARALAPEDRQRLIDTVLAVPKALGSPHLHAGLGLRKIHPKGVWEVRVDVALRLVFTIIGNDVTFVLVGNHDEVRRYLKSL